MADEEFLLVDDREVVLTPHMRVTCDGGNGALGHPMEFISLAMGGTAMCKYCGRRFIHLDNPEAAVIRERAKPAA